MTARASMSDLITKTRTLIADTGGTATQHFTDDDVLSNLDTYQELVMFERMDVTPTLVANNTLQYKNYFSRKYFEGTTGGTVTIIQNQWYGTITPTTTDFINGRYTWSTDQYPYVYYITGKRYDIYAAAADLADLWVASMKSVVDFGAGNSNFTMSQQITNLVNLAISLRGKSEQGGVNSIVLDRSDMDDIGEY